MLYRAINGDSESAAPLERREDPGTPHRGAPAGAGQPHHRYEVNLNIYKVYVPTTKYFNPKIKKYFV